MPELRDLPAIDRLMNLPELQPLCRRHGPETVKRQLRELQSEWRLAGTIPDWAADPACWVEPVARRLAGRDYQWVFNLTGTIIHTNLGRAPLPRDLFDAVRDLVTEPMNLEFDLTSGKRGDREGPVERRLTLLTGAEAATVVNNNAAALLLVLNTFGLQRQVAVSRGELIEIGGSFRLPDIMRRAGCELCEVGTTNRTHLRDFEQALGPQLALLLKVHPSNYQVTGFTKAVSVRAMADLAARSGIPFCVDLGSGTLVDLERWGLPHELTPQEVLAQGADLVTFSGDKLLGAAQAGLIVGRRERIDACRQNPLKRALRADKLTLAILDRTLALYESPDTLQTALPLLRLLTTPEPVLHERAAAVIRVLAGRLPGFTLEIRDSEAQIGSGALPDQPLPSVAVAIVHEQDRELRRLQTALRELPVPVIGRLGQRALWLDMRGAERIDTLLESLGTLATR